MRISGDWAVDQHHRAQHHGDRAAGAQNAVRREFRFQHEQRERQNQQRRAQPVDRQHRDARRARAAPEMAPTTPGAIRPGEENST